jgi:signal transduction histidine kinase
MKNAQLLKKRILNLRVIVPIDSYDGPMSLSNKQYSWLVVGVTTFLMLWGLSAGQDLHDIFKILFWFLLLASVQILPVSLGFGSEVTMGFPIHLALAMLFDPWIAMAIAGAAAFDIREFRRQIPVHRALFNRCELMLSEGAAAAVFSAYRSTTGEALVTFPIGVFMVAAVAVIHLVVNLSLVGMSVATEERVPLDQALRSLLPKPVSGFLVIYVLLSGLGAATAAVYDTGGPWPVTAFLLPLLFARLSILGARTQQELSERIREQQKALLDATERMFKEREQERHRIAEEIHDTSLQMLAAAAYGLGNANEWLNAEERIKAREAIATSRDAIEDAMKALRGSLVDLRKSAVEEGGLLETVRNFAEQMSLLWGTEIQTKGRVDVEPPIPVALAGFQILQEGLTNALKHAQGTPITVTIGNQNGMIHLTVEDNGPGFDPEQEVGTDHVGMRLMRERAARVGGSIVLDTAPGRGTKLEAILPGGVEQ